MVDQYECEPCDRIHWQSIPRYYLPEHADLLKKKSYKAHHVSGTTSANIIWTVNVFCYPNSQVPDKIYTITQKVTCQ